MLASPLSPTPTADAARPTPRGTIRLYEASEQLDTVREWLEESEGELTPEIEALLAEAGQTFDDKAVRVGLMIRELQVQANAANAEAARIEALAHAAQHAADSLKGYLLREMQRVERPKIESPTLKLRIQRNAAPSVQVPELDQAQLRALAETARWCVHLVPEQYVFDKRAIADAWKADPEAELPAGVAVTVGSHLRIR